MMVFVMRVYLCVFLERERLTEIRVEEKKNKVHCNCILLSSIQHTTHSTHTSRFPVIPHSGGQVRGPCIERRRGSRRRPRRSQRAHRVLHRRQPLPLLSFVPLQQAQDERADSSRHRSRDSHGVRVPDRGHHLLHRRSMCCFLLFLFFFNTCIMIMKCVCCLVIDCVSC